MTWYSQNDPRWKNARLGLADGITIGNDGCYVTAFTNMANDCGKNINVAQLDQIFTDTAGKGGYVEGDQCTDDMLTKVYSDIVYRWSKYYQDAADLSQLNNDVHIKQILEVDGQPNTPGLQSHFVYFYDYYNGIVRVIDSWTGLLISLADVYGDPATCIYKIVTYEFDAATSPIAVAPPVDPAPVIPPPHAPATIPVPTPTPPVVKPPVTPSVPPVKPPVKPTKPPVAPVAPKLTWWQTILKWLGL